jgi:hypothetical protein
MTAHINPNDGKIRMGISPKTYTTDIYSIGIILLNGLFKDSAKYKFVDNDLYEMTKYDVSSSNKVTEIESKQIDVYQKYKNIDADTFNFMINNIRKMLDPISLNRPTAYALLETILNTKNENENEILPIKSFTNINIKLNNYWNKFFDKHYLQWNYSDVNKHPEILYMKRICGNFKNVMFKNCKPVKYLHINNKMILILISWLLQVCKHFKLCIDTIFNTIASINLYDDINIKQDELQGYGVMSLQFTSMYFDMYHPTLNDLVGVTAKAFTEEKLVDIGYKLFSTLRYIEYVPIMTFVNSKIFDIQMSGLFVPIEILQIQAEILRLIFKWIVFNFKINQIPINELIDIIIYHIIIKHFTSRQHLFDTKYSYLSYDLQIYFDFLSLDVQYEYDNNLMEIYNGLATNF